MSFKEVLRGAASSPRAAAAVVVVDVVVAAAAGAWSLRRAGEVRTTLGRMDFEPPEAERSGGRFRLVVANDSGRENLTFRLLGAGGREILRGQTTGASGWARELDLPPGQYVLTEMNNPAQLFTVKVR